MAEDPLAGMPQDAQDAAARYIKQAEALSREATAQAHILPEIPYGKHPLQRLDIYLPPEAATGALPVLVMLHGGRWRLGRKELMGCMAPAVTGMPAILVAPTFRRAPEFRMPALAEDVAAAVAWVYRHIGEHGGDPARLYLGGHSSGGHLAALVALRKDFTAAHGLPPDAIKGCFPMCGTFDLDFPNPEPGSEGAVIMDTVLARREDAPAFSPVGFVAGNRTPFYIVYGARDFPRVMDSGERMIELLSGQPGRVEHQVFEGLGHFDVVLEARRADGLWMRTVRSWMGGPAAD